MAKKGGDSTEGAKDDKNKKDNNSRLSRKISKYLRKQFYGSSDRSMISRDDHKKIRAEIDQTNTILDDTRKIDTFKMLLEANEKVPTTGQLVEKAGEMLQYENAMWDQGVHPEEFKERYEKAQKNLEAVDHHNRKRVTSRDTNAYLSEWKNDRTELSTLIDKFRQKPEEVQKEVAEKLPALVKKAQETLERLNRIQDWKNNIGFDSHRGFSNR